MSLALEHVYRYPRPSSFEEADGAPRLRLAASSPEAASAPFFEALLVHPECAARLLRYVGGLAGTRFFVPPGMLERLLREADPVLTSGAELLRVESFSACAGAYARLDLRPGALRASRATPGTTNVDFGPEVRAALARVRPWGSLALCVGQDEVQVDAGTAAAVERRVALPLRWLKSFLEVGAVQARMEPCFRVSAAEATRFLRSLPRRSSRNAGFVVEAGGGLRLAQRATAAGVPLAGPERLSGLRELAGGARELRVFRDPRGGSSAWVLDFGDEALTVVLSPETWRGFSGEGQALEALAAPDRDVALARVRAALAWDDAVRPGPLAARLDLPETSVLGALAALGTRGLVGYDLEQATWFRRELPFDLAAVEQLHPRLVAARRLVEQGAVRVLTRGDVTEAEVAGTGVVHRVRLAPDGGRCTCPWHAQHQGTRGPCKHQLAVSLAEEGERS